MISRTVRVLGPVAVAAVLMVGCIEQPPATTTTTTVPEPELPVPGTCYESSNPNQADILYNGPIDTFDNVRVHTSTDGTCTGPLFLGGPPSFVRSWVHATSNAEAATACAGLSTPSTPQSAPVATVYTEVPADIWSCLPAPPQPN